MLWSRRMPSSTPSADGWSTACGRLGSSPRARSLALRCHRPIVIARATGRDDYPGDHYRSRRGRRPGDRGRASAGVGRRRSARRGRAGAGAARRDRGPDDALARARLHWVIGLGDRETGRLEDGPCRSGRWGGRGARDGGDRELAARITSSLAFAVAHLGDLDGSIALLRDAERGRDRKRAGPHRGTARHRPVLEGRPRDRRDPPAAQRRRARRRRGRGRRGALPRQPRRRAGAARRPRRTPSTSCSPPRSSPSARVSTSSPARRAPTSGSWPPCAATCPGRSTSSRGPRRCTGGPTPTRCCRGCTPITPRPSPTPGCSRTPTPWCRPAWRCTSSRVRPPNWREHCSRRPRSSSPTAMRPGPPPPPTTPPGDSPNRTAPRGPSPPMPWRCKPAPAVEATTRRRSRPTSSRWPPRCRRRAGSATPRAACWWRRGSPSSRAARRASTAPCDRRSSMVAPPTGCCSTTSMPWRR